MPLDKERVGEPVEEIACKPVAVAHTRSIRAEVLHDDRKFVSGQAADYRTFGHCRTEALGDRLQRCVAGQVTEGIVDFLEIINVDVKEAQCFTGPACFGNSPLQQMLKLHAVGHLGQRIDAREIANALFRAAALGNVLRSVNKVKVFVFVVTDCRTGIGHRDRFAELAFEKCFFRQIGTVFLNERRRLAAIDDEIDRHSNQLVLFITKKHCRRLIDTLNRAVVGRNDDGFIHTGEQAVQVVACNSR